MKERSAKTDFVQNQTITLEVLAPDKFCENHPDEYGSLMEGELDKIIFI